jgi:hypothetical protein
MAREVNVKGLDVAKIVFQIPKGISSRIRLMKITESSYSWFLGNLNG